MKPLTLETLHHIPAFEADVMSLWRPEAIFRCMQELAGEHSDALGCGRMALLKRGIVWMLARTHLRMERYPRLYENVRAVTWPGPAGRVTYPRYFTFEDETGAPLGCAATSWMLVDLAARRIIPPARAGLDFPDTAACPPPLPEPKRFRLAQAGAPCLAQRAPQYGDVDMNGHMNNASYIGWLCDLFPLARHREARIRALLISYAAEAVPGEQVALSLYAQGDSFELLGADAGDGHTVFEAMGEWGALHERER